jgi:hypothetical protein
MNKIEIKKNITFNLQAVDEILISYDNGEGWRATVEFYVDGHKLEKVFGRFPSKPYETLQSLVLAIDEYLKQL